MLVAASMWSALSQNGLHVLAASPYFRCTNKVLEVQHRPDKEKKNGSLKNIWVDGYVCEESEMTLVTWSFVYAEFLYEQRDEESQLWLLNSESANFVS